MHIRRERRRDFIGIIADILTTSKTGARKTQIMYKANLSFTQLNDYLNYLVNNELLIKTYDDGNQIYVVTRKGLDFLHQHFELTRLLKEDGNPQNKKSTVQRRLLENMPY